MGGTADTAASGEDDDGAPLGGAGLPRDDADGPPDDVVLAVRLMYAGAGLAALLGLLRVIDPDAFRDALASSGDTGTMSSDSQLAGYVTFAIFTAGVWLLIAWGCRRGGRWYRAAGTAFGTLYVTTTVVALFQVELNVATVASVLMAAVAAAVLWLLWRPESSRWFAAGGRSGENRR
ncbi:hypothetical protein [Jiangella asiatica]|uniref:Uncharacterized protein n=1 Tax=Jiangella asiatica TaxID=2530372 RepID=A0A4R5CQ25_9ACTN|nr:hypothetical protein [Jiangella asiatica]TDE00911.1 hypothetical protein E1269_24275 [Jiangella asiatica]